MTENVSFVAKLQELLKPLTDLVAKYVEWKDVLIAASIALGLRFLPLLGPAAAAIGAIVAPIALVLLKFTALTLGIALLRTAWENDWGGIQEKFRVVLDYLQNRFGPLVQAIKDFGFGALQEIVNWATGNKTQFENVGRIWDTAKETGKRLFNDLVYFVQTTLPVWIRTLGEWASAAWTWIRDTALPVALQKLSDYRHILPFL